MESINEVDIPNSIDSLIEKLKGKQRDLDDLVFNIRNLVDAHTHSLAEPYEPKSIIESRFTPAEEAFEKGFRSCGAMVNIGTEALRKLGYEVKLVHGESEDSVDHAWISVYDPETSLWKEFDLTRKNLDIPPTHIKKGEVDSWEEIRDQIESDHETLIERREKRGLV